MRRSQEAPSSPTTRRFRARGAAGRPGADLGRAAPGRAGERGAAGGRGRSAIAEGPRGSAPAPGARAARAAGGEERRAPPSRRGRAGLPRDEVVERLPLELDEDAEQRRGAPALQAAPRARRVPRARQQEDRQGETGPARRRPREESRRREERPRSSGLRPSRRSPAARPASAPARGRWYAGRALAHNPRPASLAPFLMAVNESLRVLRTTPLRRRSTIPCSCRPARSAPRTQAGAFRDDPGRRGPAARTSGARSRSPT